MGLGIYGGHQREVGKGSKMQKRTGNQGMNRRNYIKCVYIYILYTYVCLYIYMGEESLWTGEKETIWQKNSSFLKSIYSRIWKL